MVAYNESKSPQKSRRLHLHQSLLQAPLAKSRMGCHKPDGCNSPSLNQPHHKAHMPLKRRRNECYQQTSANSKLGTLASSPWKKVHSTLALFLMTTRRFAQCLRCGLTNQLTDGGPSVTPEYPDGPAWPPFGAAPGSANQSFSAATRHCHRTWQILPFRRNNRPPHVHPGPPKVH